MSRRALTYAVLLVTSVVIAACSTPTAPRPEDTTGGNCVWQGNSGWYCT